MRNLMFNLTLALLLAGVYVILGGCTDKSDDQTDPFTFEPTKDQFKSGALNVGSIVNIDSVRNAILLGARQVNEAGGILGKELNLLALKARDTEHAVSLAQEMFEYDIKLVNVSYSSRSKAVAALAIPKGIPIISESATSTFFTDFNDNDLYFRMVPSDVYQAQLLALLAREAGHETAITVHNDTDQYGETLISLFSSEFEDLGGRVLEQVAVPFSVTQGFATYIQPILQLSPDVVLNVVLEADESANFVNEALQAGVSSRFLFPDASAGIPAFANNLVDAEAIADDLGTAPGFGLVTNPQMMFFDQAYRQTFDTAPSTFDVNGYDFVMIAALAIEHAGVNNNTVDPTPAMVKDSLRAVMNSPGEKVGPKDLVKALALIRAGEAIDYSGSYGDNDWDENGDIKGEITYNILSINPSTGQWQTIYQEQLFVP